jgi:hypothetical protein
MLELKQNEIMNVSGGVSCRCFDNVGQATQRMTVQHSVNRPVDCINACCGMSRSANLGFVFSDLGGNIRSCATGS